MIPENPRVRRIAPDGTITLFAGTGATGSGGDGEFATGVFVALALPRGTSVAPDGSVYIAVESSSRIRRVAPIFPGVGSATTIIASEDGRQAYVFDPLGRHLQTVSTLTGTPDATFAYDSAGRLATITDGDGNVTTIERDGSGNPTAIVAPPGGAGALRTTLALPTAQGYI